MSNSRIELYGDPWCSDCVRVKDFLVGHDISVSYHDVSISREYQARVIELSGDTKVPLVVFPDGSFLSEPTSIHLREKLVELSMI
jgi:mycoredoxin